MKIQLLKDDDLSALTQKREGEKKIGEFAQTIESLSIENLNQIDSPFVVLGIKEDLGPRANCGRGGSDSAWDAFLPKFLNIQHNKFLKGEDVLILGVIDFTSIPNYNSTDLGVLRKLVEEIDTAISEAIELIVKANKIPVVIGGGHNNSYPILKGCSKAKKQPINCINLDPHADFRPLEGRHSGNGFSYAKAEGYLNKYFVCGLHQNYNSQSMLNIMKENGVGFNFQDQFLSDSKLSFETLIAEGFNYIKDQLYGIEMDCDSIQNFPSSAQTPSGISPNEARKYIHMAAKKNSIYLHLPEAAPSLVKNSNEQVGKLLSYLVSDFIKAKS